MTKMFHFWLWYTWWYMDWRMNCPEDWIIARMIKAKKEMEKYQITGTASSDFLSLWSFIENQPHAKHSYSKLSHNNYYCWLPAGSGLHCARLAVRNGIQSFFNLTGVARINRPELLGYKLRHALSLLGPHISPSDVPEPDFFTSTLPFFSNKSTFLLKLENFQHFWTSWPCTSGQLAKPR